MEKKYAYNREIRFFLIFIPVINVFNYYLTYDNIGIRWRTLLTFSIDTAEGYAAWLAIHLIIVFLDREIPFGKNPLKRLVIQLSATLMLSLGIIIGLTLLVNFLFSDKPVPLNFFFHDLIIISIWIPVINSVYIGLYFFHQWRSAEAQRSKEIDLRTGGIRVKTGRQERILNYENIIAFMADGEYVVCHSTDQRKYMLDQTLDSLEKSLPPIHFFRLNRSVLAHRQVISGFEKADYGKLIVLFKPDYSQTLSATVSRIKAAGFKDWFEPAG